MGPNGILCTRWEKEYASARQTFVACDDCLVKNEAYDAEKKAHTNKRVSVIACDNAISKVQCAPHRPEGNPFHKTHARYLYLRGKKHSVRLAGINCFMELSRLNVIELTNLALSVATILTRDLTVSETECLLKFLCIVRDDISLILCDKRNDK